MYKYIPFHQSVRLTPYTQLDCVLPARSDIADNTSFFVPDPEAMDRENISMLPCVSDI